MTELQDVRHGARAAREDAHRRRAGRRRPRDRGAQPLHRRARRHRAQGHASTTSAAPSPSPARYQPTLTRYERYRILHRDRRAHPRARARTISDLITAECGPLQEGLALRGRPRLRRVHLRRQRRAAGRRPDLLLRPHAARQEAQGLHAARAAAGRDLGDHAVQPPAEPGRAQGRAVDRDQQPDGAEAHREDAARRRCCSPTCSTRPGCRRRCSRWSPATRARSPTRCSPIPTSTSSPSPAACRSASTSRPRPSTSGRCSSSAATIRSS